MSNPTESDLTGVQRPVPMPRDLVDVWEFHCQQAKHYEPFGATNALSVYRRACATILVEAQRRLAEQERHGHHG